MNEVEPVSPKLTKAMIEAMESDPAFEGRENTRCVIFIDSANPNPPKSELPGIMGTMDLMDQVMADKIRLGDGFTEIYGDFSDGQIDHDEKLLAMFHVLQIVNPNLQSFSGMEGMDEVIDALDDAIGHFIRILGYDEGGDTE